MSSLVDESDCGHLRVSDKVDHSFLFQLVESVSELTFANLFDALQLLFFSFSVDELKQVQVLDAVLVNFAFKINLPIKLTKGQNLLKSA